MSAIRAGASTAVTSLDVKRVAPQCCVDVRFGSKADILGGLRDVRFVSNSGFAADILKISAGREVAHIASVLRKPRERG
jgi:hypothetical protein